MNREIKFEYIIETTSGEIINAELNLEEIEQFNEDLNNNSFLFSIKKIIAKRQYTGLKDKNLVEVYEGDILKFKDFKYKVEFKDGMYTYNSGTMDVRLSNLNEESEIIGNIYEDPELLNNN